MKIKFNSDDYLPLKKTPELRNMVIVVTIVFHEGNKCYPQAFLDELLCRLRMFELMYLKKLMLTKSMVCVNILFVITSIILR